MTIALISKQRPVSPESVTSDLSNNVMKKPVKQVRFTPMVEIQMFDRIHPSLKADLYYSSEEMYYIQKRFQTTIALRRQLAKSKELQESFKQSKVYIDYLSEKSEAADRKRQLDEINSSKSDEVVLVKRQRIQ